MRNLVLKDSLKPGIVPLAAWSLTCLMGLAIAGNAFFNQPDTGRSQLADIGGSSRMEVDAPDSGGRTIQLKFDPVVENVQRELASAGYYKGPIDGVIGRKTRQAIAAYQAAAGIEPDGKPSADLVDHIKFTREVSEASLFTGSIAPDPDADARARVRRVQTGLAELAYTPGEINGEMNGQTRDAIVAFQHDRKLPETGEVTDDLIAELGKMSGQSEMSAQ
jgi:peptidoglycan hydrolase-like protein with peptidoglycan-binding domain